MTTGIYGMAKYYDIAFGWDISLEIQRLINIFDTYADIPINELLEPACGSGRFLVKFPQYGFNITGYDSSPEMAEYAAQKIISTGVEDKAEVFCRKMQSADFPPVFDAAFNVINSIGYLISDEEILQHLKLTCRSLLPGGIYVIQLACAFLTDLPGNPVSWVEQKNGIRIETTWWVESEDLEEKISYQRCKMEIQDKDRHFQVSEPHRLRLWLHEDILNLIRQVDGLELQAVCTETLTELQPSFLINGKLGNLYYIIKRKLA